MDKILILDFGSQYTQLIARRVREAKVYCEIHPPTWTAAQVRAFAPQGIILSGGPASVHDAGAPRLDPDLCALGIPVLGICYGMQSLAQVFGGHVARAHQREYGHARVTFDTDSALTRHLPNDPISVWMSHGDHVEELPAGFRGIARSDAIGIAAMADEARRVYGVQFHPEVAHTQHGETLLRNFLFTICGCRGDWAMESFAERAVAHIRATVGDAHVVCGVSGGVDSSVVAALLHRAIGQQTTCIFVDTGLLRKNEAAKIPQLFRDQLQIDIISIDASERFFRALQGVTDPEAKRKIIGREFVAVFEDAARDIPNVRYLAQGTLYPDVIESVSFKGPSATIKSHHNVGGLPETMGLKLVEPLRELFKDEVRALGETLTMPRELLWRHPFPGPGLAVRILGAVTPERVTVLQNADDVMMRVVKQAGWYDRVWQMFCVLLPIHTVGVMGDERTYENVVAVRAVTSQDGMTADWAKLPHELLGDIATRIINDVRGVNRVVYDITSKPPGTIEWE